MSFFLVLIPFSFLKNVQSNKTKVLTDVLVVVLKDNQVHVHGSLFVHINCLGFTKSTVKSNDIGVV